jgi:hypothetical protein
VNQAGFLLNLTDFLANSPGFLVNQATPFAKLKRYLAELVYRQGELVY